jgi:hypothetical protein
LLGFNRLLARGVVGIKLDRSRILFDVDCYCGKRAQQYSSANKRNSDVHAGHLKFQ